MRKRDLPLLLAAVGVGYLLLQRRAIVSQMPAYDVGGLPITPESAYLSPEWQFAPEGWQTIIGIRESGQAGGFI